MPYLIRALARRKMLPAIVFIFSRAGCDQAAQSVASGLREPLLDASQQQSVQARIDAFRAAHPLLPMSEERLSLLNAGVAAHHAGMLPPEGAGRGALPGRPQGGVCDREAAAGINMPARCTAITTMSSAAIWASRRSPPPLTQMAGRAGRRGKDDIGHVVLCRSSRDGADAAHQLRRRQTDRLALPRVDGGAIRTEAPRRRVKKVGGAVRVTSSSPPPPSTSSGMPPGGRSNAPAQHRRAPAQPNRRAPAAGATSGRPWSEERASARASSVIALARREGAPRRRVDRRPHR